MVLTTLRAVNSYWDPVFLFFGKTTILFKLTIVNSVIIGGLGYFATKAFGIEGMSAVVLLSIAAITPIAGTYLKKLIRVSYAGVLMRTFAISLALIVCYHFAIVAAQAATHDSGVATIAVTIGFCIAYASLHSPDIISVYRRLRDERAR